MAPPPPDPRVAHQAGQSALMSLLSDAVSAAWARLVDPADLAGTLPRFKLTAAALVRQYGQASGSAALDHYRAQRAAAGVPGRPRLTMAAPPPVSQVAGSIDWATKDLWTPEPAAVVTVADRPAELTANVTVADRPAESRASVTVAPSPVEDAQTRVAVAAERIALNQGRDTIIEAAEKDPQAKGWARVAEPGACSFCLLLATRGAVYRSDTTGGFTAHDHCRCHVEPLFGAAYEPTAQVRAAQQVYADSTKGLSGKAARNAFRAAVAAARADGHRVL